MDAGELSNLAMDDLIQVELLLSRSDNPDLRRTYNRYWKRPLPVIKEDDTPPRPRRKPITCEPRNR